MDIKPISIYVDDERPCPQGYDFYCKTTNDAVKAVRRKYKEGHRYFLLDLDNDTEDAIKNEHGGEFTNVLRNIESYVHLGKMSNLTIDVKIHTGNVVAKQNIRNIIKGNSNWMKEVTNELF